MKAAIPTSKLPHGLLQLRLRLLDLALFLQQEHRGSTRLKAPLRLCGALQLAPRFLSRSFAALLS